MISTSLDSSDCEVNFFCLSPVVFLALDFLVNLCHVYFCKISVVSVVCHNKGDLFSKSQLFETTIFGQSFHVLKLNFGD